MLDIERASEFFVEFIRKNMPALSGPDVSLATIDFGYNAAVGTGTTCAVARRLGRRFIGLERDPDYAAIARKRIAEVQSLATEDIAPTPNKRSEPRVPFGVLIEAGLLPPGTALSDSSGQYHAGVRADGTLSSANALGQHRGSIHQVGAAVQGAPACNGWTFWHFELEGTRLPIDHRRQQVRSGL